MFCQKICMARDRNRVTVWELYYAVFKNRHELKYSQIGEYFVCHVVISFRDKLANKHEILT